MYRQTHCPRPSPPSTDDRSGSHPKQVLDSIGNVSRHARRRNDLRERRRRAGKGDLSWFPERSHLSESGSSYAAGATDSTGRGLSVEPERLDHLRPCRCHASCAPQSAGSAGHAVSDHIRRSSAFEMVVATFALNTPWTQALWPQRYALAVFPGHVVLGPPCTASVASAWPCG